MFERFGVCGHGAFVSEQRGFCLRAVVLIGTVLLLGGHRLFFSEPALADGLCVPGRVSEEHLWLERGRQAIAEGALSRAEACLMRSMLLAPGDHDVQIQIGVAFSDIERWSEAELAFRRSLRIQPLDAAALNGLGYIYYRNQFLERAIAYYRQAIALVSAPQYQLNLGLAFLKQERWGEAADRFRQVIAEEPLNYWAHNNLGFALDCLGFAQEAVSEYRIAAGISNGDLTAMGNLGALFLREHAWLEAASVYEAILNLDDTLAEAHMGLAEAFLQMRRDAAARREAALAVVLEPNNARARYVKAVVLARIGRHRAALGLVLQSLDRDGTDPDAHALCVDLARRLSFPSLQARSEQALQILVGQVQREGTMVGKSAPSPDVP